MIHDQEPNPQAFVVEVYRVGRKYPTFAVKTEKLLGSGYWMRVAIKRESGSCAVLLISQA